MERSWNTISLFTGTYFFSNFIYNISLSITSANLAKKAICTWLAYKKNNNKHNNNDKERAIVYTTLFQ